MYVYVISVQVYSFSLQLLVNVLGNAKSYIIKLSKYILLSMPSKLAISPLGTAAGNFKYRCNTRGQSHHGHHLRNYVYVLCKTNSNLLM